MYNVLAPLQASFGQPVTALAFDPVSDVLWTGDQQGTVAAYNGATFSRAVAFPVASTSGIAARIPTAVSKLATSDDVVRACSITPGAGLGGWNKGGNNKWYYTPPGAGSTSSTSVCTFAASLSPSATLASISTSSLLLLNTAASPSPNVVRQSPTPSLVTHLTCTSTVAVAGCSDGFLRTYDPRTTLIRSSLSTSAHQGGISGLATGGYYVYSIGWGFRAGRPHPDPFAKIYDIRASPRSLASVAFPSGPSFIGVHPSKPSGLFIVAGEGSFVQMVDVTDTNSIPQGFTVMANNFITSFAVSPTGSYLALGDGEGYVHILTSDNLEEKHRTPLNGFDGQATPYPDQPEFPPEIQWNDLTPLNSIGMPYYTTPLLSSTVPSPRYSTTHSLPPKLPTQVLLSMKQIDGIGYASLPSELRGRRNVVTSVGSGHKSQASGRFRSVKKNEEPETPVKDVDPSTVPRMFRKVEIEYSKFGVEDFDFEFYNKTPYSGLETHILNSYTNSLIQALFFTTPVRTVAKSHLTVNCVRENCLLCELGFVCKMLEDAKGVNCQASNFCKVISNSAQANAMGLVDFAADSQSTRLVDYSSMIQLFNRFLLEQLAIEAAPFPLILPKNATVLTDQINQLFGTRTNTVVECLGCHEVKEKQSLVRVIDLLYASKSSVTIQDVVLASLVRETTHKATCGSCKQVCIFSSRREVKNEELPPILAINACVYNEEHKASWCNKLFLDGGRIDLNGVTYTLRAILLQISSRDESPHLVSVVKVPDPELSPEAESSWFMFNDFVVRNIPEQEALSFSAPWKTPSVLYFERIDVEAIIDLSSLPMTLDSSILNLDVSISPNRDLSIKKHRPLSFSEMPKPGTLIAIDAEFVQMQQEEIEYRADGSKRVLRPSRLSLARVSVLRGEGPDQGLPCIDDHIHTSETIVNYLTEFSGIKFGDLDPNISRHTLVPLKVAYKKLRLLVDLGCVFIGHGLQKDFRIINIFVPKERVIDTVDLYYLEDRQRRLSLRFLTWFILRQDIQQETHDSIEDARSALLLYTAYEQFEEQGVVDEKLGEIYKIGKHHNWKPPSSNPELSAPAPMGFISSSSSGNPRRRFEPAQQRQPFDIGQRVTSPPGDRNSLGTPPPHSTSSSVFIHTTERQQQMQNSPSWRRQR